MSAALELQADLPVLDAGLDLTLTAPKPVDAEIVIYGGLDPDTDELIENAKKAVEILSREYGVEALVVPNTIYWGMGPGFGMPYGIPVLVINGKEVSRGRVLSPDEIVMHTLMLLGHSGEEDVAPIVGVERKQLEAVATAW